jgi:hypothetical protein
MANRCKPFFLFIRHIQSVSFFYNKYVLYYLFEEISELIKKELPSSNTFDFIIYLFFYLI